MRVLMALNGHMITPLRGSSTARRPSFWEKPSHALPDFGGPVLLVFHSIILST